MIISHRRRFIFFHDPQAAGMSLRAVLAPYHDDPIPPDGIVQAPPFDYQIDFAHLRLQEISLLFPAIIEAAQSYRSLVVVRDPYRRFISAIYRHFKTSYPQLPLLTMRPEEQVLIVETFVEKIFLAQKVLTDYRFVHLSPQVCFLRSDGVTLLTNIVAIDDCGSFIADCLERLGRPLPAQTHHNRSRLDLTHLFKSAKILAFVRDFYTEDFAFFAARPALAHLAGLPGGSIADGSRVDVLANGITGLSGVAGSLEQGRTRNADVAPDATDLITGLHSVGTAAASPKAAEMDRSMDAADLMILSGEIDRAAADLAAGRSRDAFERIKLVLAKNPHFPRALGFLGQIAVLLERPALGLAPLQRAVALDPRLEHRVWLALCLAKLGCPEDAVQVISTSITNIPPTANANFAVGMVYYALGQYDEAARFYRKCIALDTQRSGAMHRYARSLQAAGKTEAAVAAFREAIENRASEADNHTDLSAALSELGRFEEACAAANTAVQLDPTSIVAHNNLGHALLNMNRAAEAVIAYETAIQICDTYAKAQFGLALALLKCGDFERGWRQYEWRWQDSQTVRLDLGVPLWRGEDATGQTILLHAEQGLGDTLQFIRFSPLVALRGAHVVLEVPSPLVRLMRGVEGVAKVIACGDPIPPIDLHCPIASLPLAFDLRVGTIPPSPYLHVPIEEAATASHRFFNQLKARLGLVVGVVWAGDPRHSQPDLNRIDRRRSTTLEVFAPLLDIAEVRFVSFQFGEARQQLAAAKRTIVDAMEGVTDFADTATRLLNVDLLISVDTSMVHLAGGLGVPVWMLSRFDGCWRWLERRDDTPWYPSMRIFRQPSLGDWPSVVATAAIALRKLVNTKPTPAVTSPLSLSNSRGLEVSSA